MTDSVADVTRYIDTRARHGFLYLSTIPDRRPHWVIEHCVDGEWGACPLMQRGNLTLDESADMRDVNAAAMRHLKRRSHPHVYPERLKRTHHA